MGILRLIFGGNDDKSDGRHDSEVPQASYPEPKAVQKDYLMDQDVCLGCGGPVSPPWNDCCKSCAARLSRHSARWMKLN